MEKMAIINPQLLETFKSYNKWLKESISQIARREVQPIIVERRLIRLKIQAEKLEQRPRIVMTKYMEEEDIEKELYLIEEEQDQFRINVETLERMISDRKNADLIQQIHTGKPSKRNQEGDTTYPAELDTPEARYILNRFSEEGIISRDGNFYSWVKPKSHFGVFVIAGNFSLWGKHYNKTNKGEGDRMKWRPFLDAFRISDKDASYMKSKLSDNIERFQDLKKNHPAFYITELFSKLMEEWEQKESEQ